MLLRIEQDLSSLAVLAEETEQESILGARQGSSKPMPVCHFDDPVLLTDTFRIGSLDYGLRDAVFALYESYPRTVEYDDVRLSWSPHAYPRVWGPSIDTIFLARALKPYLSAADSVVEVGCGSGFLTKFAIAHGAPSVAVATDISLHALRCCSDALSGLAHDTAVSLICPQPDDPTLGLASRFDLLVSNPPYIPRPGMRNDNPYEGLDLIAKFASYGDQVLTESGVMLLNISSLSGDRPEQWLAQAGWQVCEIDRLSVPLKVNAVTSGVMPESRAWLAYLLERGAIPADEDHPGYRYWHDLRVLECRRP